MNPEFNTSNFNEGKEKLIVKTKDETSYLKAEPMRDALKRAIKLPTKNKLFGQLWWENELLVVFATTGVGKTILGVQIAEAIASESPASVACLNACFAKVI